jgi:hypothetical protein
MAEDGLKLKIGADVSELRTSLDKVDRDLKAFGFTIDKIGGKKFPSLFDLTGNTGPRKLVEEVEKIKPAVETAIPPVTRLKREFEGLGNKGLTTATASVQNFGKSVNRSVPQATQAFTNLGRVVQDAPFGIIGIQNNIEPLIQSFQSLKTATGSTGGALKALAGSLVGAGGVLFAFSAISSISTVLVQKYGSLGAAFTEFASSSDRAAVGQRALNRELVKSLASQEGEISSLKSLIGILNDSNASQLQRTNAYKELKKEYPGVIQSISQENALTSEGGKLIAARSTQLIKYIQLKAKEAALIKLGEEATVKQLQAAKNSNEILESQGTVLSKLLNTILGGPGGTAQLGLIRRLKSTGDEFDSATKDAELFAKGLDNVKRELATFDPKLTGLEKVNTEIKKAVKNIASFNFIGGEVQTVELNKFIKFSDYNVSPDALKAFQSIPKAVEKTLANQPITITPKIQFGPVALEGIASLEAIKTKTQEVTTQFNEFLAPAIQTVFGALENGQSIPKALGQAFKAMIVQISATIAKAAILAVILNSIFPSGTVLGGAAVKGFGGIFKALLGQTAAPQFGGVGSGGLALSGGVLVQARGTDLVGIISGSNARIGRTG